MIGIVLIQHFDSITVSEIFIDPAERLMRGFVAGIDDTRESVSKNGFVFPRSAEGKDGADPTAGPINAIGSVLKESAVL